MPAVDLSIILVCYNMAREVPRTLRSLSRAYQYQVEDLSYEIIVVDNASEQPLPDAVLTAAGPQVRYERLEHASSSPVAAMNHGAAVSTGKWLGIMIDGARLLSPGLLYRGIRALRMTANPIVSTHGFHLGPERQPLSVAKGYNQSVEDQLLQRIDWQRDGYRLFQISSLAGASSGGWFSVPSESTCLLITRETFDRVGGMDEAFTSAGGGLVNADLFDRVCQTPDARLITLVGEGSFHQFHGGTHSNVSEEHSLHRWNEYAEEYRRVRGKPFENPLRPSLFYGRLPPSRGPSVILKPPPT